MVISPIIPAEITQITALTALMKECLMSDPGAWKLFLYLALKTLNLSESALRGQLNPHDPSRDIKLSQFPTWILLAVQAGANLQPIRQYFEGLFSQTQNNLGPSTFDRIRNELLILLGKSTTLDLKDQPNANDLILALELSGETIALGKTLRAQVISRTQKQLELPIITEVRA